MEPLQVVNQSAPYYRARYYDPGCRVATLQRLNTQNLMGISNQSAEAARTGSSSGSISRMGRAEKYLYRQGSQRNAGTPSSRQTMPSALCTCSGEMRFNSRLPQTGQCARNVSLSAINRAWNLVWQVRHRHG